MESNQIYNMFTNFKNVFEVQQIKNSLFMINDFDESSYLMIVTMEKNTQYEINRIFEFLNQDNSLELNLIKDVTPTEELVIKPLLNQSLLTQSKEMVEELIKELIQKEELQKQLQKLTDNLDYKINRLINKDVVKIERIYPNVLSVIHQDINSITLPSNKDKTSFKEINFYGDENYSFLEKKKIVVVFNKIIKKCFKFLDDDKLYLLIKKYQNQFGFEEKLILNENEFNHSAFDSYFKDKTFDNIVDFNQLFDIFKNLNSEEMVLENKIKKYLLDNFDITESPSDCISSKDLNDMFVGLLEISSKEVISFRNKLGRILLSFGLKKKRLSDGNYYYGLIRKDKNKKDEPFTLEEFNTKVKDLIQERNNI
jgi:hypothetical protein